MMEEVSSEDTNGDSTFEFLGDTTAAIPSFQPIGPMTSVLTSLPMELEATAAQSEPVFLFPSAPPLPPLLPPPPTLASDTQTVASVPSEPVCYAPRPNYDALSTSTVPSATIDLSYAPEVDRPLLPMTVSQDSSAPGVWGWFRPTDLLNKFAEKAKNSVDSMITTLDPGMKDYIYSGGDVDLLVASECDWVLSALREAFQQTFGRATVEGCPEPCPTGAPQPVGFSAGVKVAEEKCQLLRASGKAREGQALLAIQNILVEITPEKWFDLSCLVLQDHTKQVYLQGYTQPTAVPYDYITRAQDATSADYPLRWSGLAITIDQVAGTDQWREQLTGVSQRDMLLMGARALSGAYKTSQS